jgi:hypothetical protein
VIFSSSRRVKSNAENLNVGQSEGVLIIQSTLPVPKFVSL